MPQVSISMPCFGKPQRTQRAIRCLLEQEFTDWEAFVIGDCCPVIKKMLADGTAGQYAEEAKTKGSSLIIENREVHGGGFGYQITNDVIQRASGKYLVFFANDDMLLPGHLSNYLEINNTDLDYMYFNSFIDPIDSIRVSQLSPCLIGHSEIIVKTELARKCHPHTAHYGHDWEFISEIMRKGKGAKSKKGLTTYHVMHVPAYGTKDKID